MTRMAVEVRTDGIPYLWNLLPFIDQMGASTLQGPVHICEHILTIGQWSPAVRQLDLALGIGGVLLSSIGYQKSEKKAFDKLLNLINLGCALLAVLMAIISYIVLMALV